MIFQFHKVRLKVNIAVMDHIIVSEISIPQGSIKSIVKEARKSLDAEFQFHKVRLKEFTTNGLTRMRKDFNSTRFD